MTGIYGIYNKISNKYYIGQAGDIHNRWIQHRSRLKCNNHENSHLQDSYNLYGKEAFEYFIIEECNHELLDDREKYYIQQYDSYNNGYNQDKGGSGCCGYKHTEEEILKMRMIQNPKAVLQLDVNLNIVAEWISCSHAGKTLGFSTRQIKSCCNRANRQKTVKGFYFIYKEEYENGTVDWDYYLNIKAQKPKRVSQYDLQMNLIRVYESISSVCSENGYSVSAISSVCNYNSKTYKGFIWRFTDDYTEEQYIIDCNTDYSYTKNKKKRPVSQYDLSGNLICTYESVSEAVRITGFSRGSIRECCDGDRPSAHGYIWRYND